ncbi:MAG TPA: L-fucokinase [Opitutaceae bacterium]|nr:L-fucokinase [Opitutaceae bacterium]
MIETLLTVPPRLADHLNAPPHRSAWRRRLAAWPEAPVFIGADPAGRKLGSGGGTVHVLHQAWLASAPSGRRADLAAWLGASSKLVLHSGGESRRLPAYAALGKAFLPLPTLDGPAPRRFDQMLADFQISAYARTLEEAGPHAAAMITSGDVWLEFNPLQIPAVRSDITGIGMRVAPEVAQHFGVFFVRKNHPTSPTPERPIAFFLQKPAPAEIHRHLLHYDFYVDTGMWLLSSAAVQFLFRRCGWDERRRRFRAGEPSALDLYTEIGSALGTEAKPPPSLRRLGFPGLSASVVPLDDARFHHLGSNRQLFESLEKAQKNLAPARAFFIAADAARFEAGPRTSCWVDNSAPSARLRLAGHNLLTGLPAGARIHSLPAGVCLDVAPVGSSRYVFRPYHLDDLLRGRPGVGGLICGQDARQWLMARAQPAPDADVFHLPLYPVLAAPELTQELLNWFFTDRPDPAVSRRFPHWRRLAAGEIPGRMNFGRHFAERRTNLAAALQADFTAYIENMDTRVLTQDLKALAAFARTEAPGLRRWLWRRRPALLSVPAAPEDQSRLLMLLAELGGPARDSQRYQQAAFGRLQAAMVSSNQLARARPHLSLKEDQIVWGRSPVRLDLAGGWTDTPPFCLDHGGTVLNVAVLLNGQPPIQVFIRPLREPLFRLRSIDLGSSETITSYAALATYRDPRSNFSLPKAALALAGFHPDFFAGRPRASLRAQLAAFGGGLEISLLSAVPKGSGLGTSSILGATLLASLNRACGLGWAEVDLYNRVLGVEQLLTTGGGWQDQAGALFRSVKLIETQPGLAQVPAVRYLSDQLFGPACANRIYLLYYTGVTRLAKGILKEIVRDMFLNRCETRRTLESIRANAWQLYHAIEQHDPEAVSLAVARSWRLNRRLDAGTTTPEIEKIIAACGPDLAAGKLLGAGGGGYMLMCARDADAGQRIRARLEARPPNRRARFIDFSVADSALRVTVS